MWGRPGRSVLRDGREFRIYRTFDSLLVRDSWTDAGHVGLWDLFEVYSRRNFTLTSQHLGDLLSLAHVDLTLADAERAVSDYLGWQEQRREAHAGRGSPGTTESVAELTSAPPRDDPPEEDGASAAPGQDRAAKNVQEAPPASAHHAGLASGSVRLKDFADVIAAALSTHRISHLYHFTDEANLASIRSHGLLSREACIRRGVKIPSPGGDPQSQVADMYVGTSDFVHLSFCQDHPMKHVAVWQGRITNCVVLRVRADVLLWDTTRYSDRNAVDRRAQVGGTQKHFELVRLHMFQPTRRWTTPEEKSLFQAEALVHECVPPHLISRADGGVV